jgi:hypothetical protein
VAVLFYTELTFVLYGEKRMSRSLPNLENGIYTIKITDGKYRIFDENSEVFEDLAAYKIGKFIVDHSDPERHVYVGQLDNLLKIGLSGNLERRKSEHEQKFGGRFTYLQTILCRGRKEALNLEQAILGFLKTMLTPYREEEWFVYREHDKELICRVLEMADPVIAKQFFQELVHPYTQMKAIEKVGDKPSILNYIVNRERRSLVQNHMFTEFGFLPTKNYFHEIPFTPIQSQNGYNSLQSN